jgi:hypothetical protein
MIPDLEMVKQGHVFTISVVTSVRPIGMIPDLEMVMQGHVFTISVIIMDLLYKDAYPILLGQPWLRTAQ